MKEVAEVTDKSASIGMKGAFTEENTSGSRGEPFLGEEEWLLSQEKDFYIVLSRSQVAYILLSCCY